jgi:hypothetical protein
MTSDEATVFDSRSVIRIERFWKNKVRNGGDSGWFIGIVVSAACPPAN